MGSACEPQEKDSVMPASTVNTKDSFPVSKAEARREKSNESTSNSGPQQQTVFKPGAGKEQSVQKLTTACQYLTKLVGSGRSAKDNAMLI